jgi:hypothetical protein
VLRGHQLTQLATVADVPLPGRGKVRAKHNWCSAVSLPMPQKGHPGELPY